MKKLVAFMFTMTLVRLALGQSIWVMDFVEVKNNRTAESEYFINQNWKLFREEALKKRVIKSYQVLKTTPDSTHSYSYILMTEFADSASFKNVESNFRPIMKAIRPNGPLMLNEVKPNDFRAIRLSLEALQFIQSGDRKKRK